MASTIFSSILFLVIFFPYLTSFHSVSAKKPISCGRFRSAGWNASGSMSVSASASASASASVDVKSQIVGGNFAKLGQVPWQVLIDFEKEGGDGVVACGGSIVDETHVITAAHCFGSGSPIRVYAGIVDIPTKNFSHTGQARYVGRWEIHPKYKYAKDGPKDKRKGNHFEGDIAVVTVTTPFTFGPWVQPVCLPDSSLPLHPGEKLGTSGFGFNLPTGQNDGRLRVIDIPLHRGDECFFRMTEYGILFKPESMLCAGYLSGGRGNCQGDSGGPVIKIVQNRAFLVGSVSYNSGICAVPEQLSAYTDVRQYVDWINWMTSIM